MSDNENDTAEERKLSSFMQVRDSRVDPGFSFAAARSNRISTGQRVSTDDERMPAMSFGGAVKKSFTSPKKNE